MTQTNGCLQIGQRTVPTRTGDCVRPPQAILTRVRLHVLVEVLLHVEVLAAPLAHELLVPNVDAHEGAELILVREPLVAVFTSEGFLSRTLRGVQLE